MIKTLLLLFLIALPPKQETRVKQKEMDLYTFLWQKKLARQWERVEEVFIDCIIEADATKLLSLWKYLEEPQKRFLVQNDHFFPISNTKIEKMNPLTAFIIFHSNDKKANPKDCTIIVRELIRYKVSWDDIDDDDMPILNQWIDNETVTLLDIKSTRLS